jgi:hypothetical protein
MLHQSATKIHSLLKTVAKLKYFGREYQNCFSEGVKRGLFSDEAGTLIFLFHCLR